MIDFYLKSQQRSGFLTFWAWLAYLCFRFTCGCWCLELFLMNWFFMFLRMYFVRLSKYLKGLFGIVFFKGAHGVKVGSILLKILLFFVRRRLFLWKITLRTYRSIIFTFALSSLHITLTKLQLYNVLTTRIFLRKELKFLASLWFCQEFSRSHPTTISMRIDSVQNDKALSY